MLILHSRKARIIFFEDLTISCGRGAGPTWEPRAELVGREGDGLTISCRGGSGPTWDTRAELAGREGRARRKAGLRKAGLD